MSVCTSFFRENVGSVRLGVVQMEAVQYGQYSILSGTCRGGTGMCANVVGLFWQNIGLFWQNVGLFWQNVEAVEHEHYSVLALVEGARVRVTALVFEYMALLAQCMGR